MLITLQSILVVIVSGAHTRGECLRNSIGVILGIAIGVAIFIATASAPGSPLKAFIFFILILPIAYIRSHGLEYRPFFLTTVLFSFQGNPQTPIIHALLPMTHFSQTGIYTALLDGTFETSYLLQFIFSYLLGWVIPLFVNLLLAYPAEILLRTQIVTALKHISLEAHLISKNITDSEGLDEELKLQPILLADYEALTVTCHYLSCEISPSKFSRDEFTKIVAIISSLQQALKTARSALSLLHKKTEEGNVSRVLLSGEESKQAFLGFRHGQSTSSSPTAS